MNYFTENDVGFDSDWIAEDIEVYPDENEDAIDWLSGSIRGGHRQSAHGPRFVSGHGNINDDDLRAGIQAVMQIVPAVVQALRNRSSSREAFEELTGLDVETINPEDIESWPAIIGAIATSLPTVINAVSSISGRGRQRRRGPQQPQTAPGASTQSPSQCASGTFGEDIESEQHSEAVQLATLIPILMQLLPVILPIIAQLMTMLAKALPAIFGSISTLTKAAGATSGTASGGATGDAPARKETFGDSPYEMDDSAFQETSDSAHDLSNEQIASIWEDARENEFPLNPEAVPSSEDDFGGEASQTQAV